MINRPKAITKVLSLNDTGETGGHQAGILIPKDGEVLSFFPDLGNQEKNPRASMYFEDEIGTTWKFNFIYYNNKFHDPKGTRNEYRLTGMTAYFRENDLHAGDIITLIHRQDGVDVINYQRAQKLTIKTIETTDGQVKKRLVIGTEWKVIDC